MSCCQWNLANLDPVDAITLEPSDGLEILLYKHIHTQNLLCTHTYTKPFFQCHCGSSSVTKSNSTLPWWLIRVTYEQLIYIIFIKSPIFLASSNTYSDTHTCFTFTTICFCNCCGQNLLYNNNKNKGTVPRWSVCVVWGGGGEDKQGALGIFWLFVLWL